MNYTRSRKALAARLSFLVLQGRCNALVWLEKALPSRKLWRDKTLLANPDASILPKPVKVSALQQFVPRVLVAGIRRDRHHHGGILRKLVTKPDLHTLSFSLRRSKINK